MTAPPKTSPVGRPVATAVIVGGSLCGLACAVALGRQGVAVTVLERRAGAYPGGAGLGIDLGLLSRVTGADAARGIPVVRTSRDSAAWSAIHDWLRDVAAGTPGVTLQDDVDVRRVDQGEGWAAAVAADGTPDGTAWRGDIVVGADGYRSVVRAAVDPERPDADYAGYGLWRGLTRETDMPGTTRWARAGDGIAVLWAGPYRLVAYVVPGADGSHTPGQRQVSWAWYDPYRTALFEALGCVTGGRVTGSLTPARMPDALLAELQEFATRAWPDPWRQAVVTALARREAFATPIAEYVPRRMARGRVAVAGDAAHVASPMTGRGLVTGLEDAEALGAACGVPSGAADALARYERARLPAARALVLQGRAWGADYLRAVGADPAGA